MCIMDRGRYTVQGVRARAKETDLKNVLSGSLGTRTYSTAQNVLARRRSDGPSTRVFSIGFIDIRNQYISWRLFEPRSVRCV